MTKIHHTTYYNARLKLAHIQFLDCNLSCKGCLRKLTVWDWHLPSVDVAKLERLPKRNLEFQEFKELIYKMKEDLGIERAVLGGGEPTVDSGICDIIAFLNSLNLVVTMETNAYTLDESLTLKLLEAGLKEIVISIKASDEEKHKFYTGGALEPVLKNFSIAYKAGFKLQAVSIFIPALIEKREIEDIAKFISKLSSDIPYTVIPYIPVPQAPWRQPTVEEVEEASQAAGRYLKKVRIDRRSNNPIVIESFYPKLSL